MSRPFRPRPLDIHKKLPIVKSVKDLDSEESGLVTRASFYGNAVSLSEVEPVQAPTPTKRRAGEIPTPQFVDVDSYERDYQRTFLQPPTYVRCRPARNEASEFVEYDLDSEDEDWLDEFNKDRDPLSPESFEWLLYKLEILDHKARERGGIPAVFGVAVPVVLQEEAAFEVLQSQIPNLEVLSSVFNYWRKKRQKWEKPVLRRLQPPPPVNDTNPFNVFRPREKLHRPNRKAQRRENDVTSFEKMRMIRANLEQARLLVAMLQKREEKKRELLDCEVNLQRTRLSLKHDNDVDDDLSLSDGLVTSTTFQRKSVGVSNGRFIHSSEEPVAGSLFVDHTDNARRIWKRRRAPFQARSRPSKRVTSIDTLEPVLLFTRPLDLEKLTAVGIVPPLDTTYINGSNQTTAPYHLHGRIGRGGRLIFDRWDPLTQMPKGCNSNFSDYFRSPVTVPFPHKPRLNNEKENLGSDIGFG